MDDLDTDALASRRSELVGLARYLGLPREAAEDAAQACLLDVLRQVKTGRQIDNPVAYLKTSLRRRCSKYRRDALRFDDETCAPELSVPDAQWHMALTEVQSALHRLPKAQADLLRRVAAGDQSPQRLARELGLPEGTIMSRLARGRARLREELGLKPGDPFL
ncbi:RNA polymerase sigma factor [Primorskyibacter sp. S187A]|uniref:RNA polymerase sigma factor n=1 Tax=Primorskyibacter sp. S187A TaxID=3415130 RepID=UPI003C7EB053